MLQLEQKRLVALPSEARHIMKREIQREILLRAALLLALANISALLRAQVVPPPSNEVVGINIDRFIGSPFQSHPEITHGAMIKRTILTHGDPATLGEPRAVLQYRKELSLGTLTGGSQTPMTTIAEQLFFYVQSGEGRLDNGREYWVLKEGIAALIPPKEKHRLSSLSREPLQMIMLVWVPPPGVIPAAEILVRDVNLLPFTGRAHWSYTGKNLFNPAHGLHPNESFHVVYVAPMSIGEPHAHVPQWEEIWTKLAPDNSFLMLGSEVREMPFGTAFLAPPNGKTVHSVVNLTKDRTMAWLFISRFTSKLPDFGRDPLVAPKLMPAAE
jgi:cupin domain